MGLVIAVFIGGVLGAPARYLVDRFIKERFGATMPWGTLAVNVLGSAILGLFMGLASNGRIPHAVLSLIGTGFCGALTTFSTFSADTFKLIEAGSANKAWGNVLLNLIIGMAILSLGYLIGGAF
ncbi:fluoride efflux transporter CrcB [Nonomuraea sp. NPDC046570]|uniref:fluoride efflux transporter CrcB n=1 Tax=Nonomuraea sp. NPDC046570 TaxID=3155255 RepID=UPI00340929ED